jgi:hypothetical protein
MENNIMELKPEQQVIVEQAEEISALATTFKISTQMEYDQAGEYRKNIKGAIKQIEELRFSFTRPLDQLKKKWMDFFNVPLTKLTTGDGVLERGRLTFAREQERIRQEAERKLQAEAEKKRLAAEKKAAEARAAGNEAKAERFEEKAAAVISPELAPTFEKTSGIGTVKRWKFEITDEKLIPRRYLTPNLVQIGKEVRASGDMLNIPGIKIYAEEGEMVRA